MPKQSKAPKPPRTVVTEEMGEAIAMAGKKTGVTVNTLWEKTGVDRRTIKKILEEGGARPVGVENLGNRESTLYDEEEALTIIEHWKANNAAGGRDGNALQRKIMELRISKEERRERIAQNLEDGSYMDTTEVEQIFTTLCQALDQVPGKLKSELGLNDAQKKRVEQLLDEARAVAARKILKNVKTVKAEVTPDDR